MTDRYRTTATRERARRESFVEDEQVVLEGIDISGHWNRMYEAREITDYDLTHLDKLVDIPGAESMAFCYQCAQCVPACPVDTAGGDYGPRKIYRRLRSRTAWVWYLSAMFPSEMAYAEHPLDELGQLGKNAVELL